MPELKHMTSMEVHYKRIRGDMDKTNKILTVKYDSVAAPTLVEAHSLIARSH